MLRVLSLVITAFLLLAASPAKASPGPSFVLLVSSSIAPYEEAREQAIRVFQQMTADSGPKSAVPHTVETYYLDKQQTPESLQAKLIASPPAVILPIGAPALSLATGIPDVPLVFSMTPGVDAFLTRHPAITGVRLEISPSVQLTVMQKLFPGKPPLLLYDATQNGEFARIASEAARKKGISLVTLSAAVPRDIPRLLSVLADDAGIFWMIPDTTVVTPDNVEQIVATSLSRKVPVVTFAEKYLSQGAAIALTASPASMGGQAARIALGLAGEKSRRVPPPAYPNHIRVICNRSILEKVGAQPPESMPPTLSVDANEVRLEMVYQN